MSAHLETVEEVDCIISSLLDQENKIKMTATTLEAAENNQESTTNGNSSQPTTPMDQTDITELPTNLSMKEPSEAFSHYNVDQVLRSNQNSSQTVNASSTTKLVYGQIASPNSPSLSENRSPSAFSNQMPADFGQLLSNTVDQVLFKSSLSDKVDGLDQTNQMEEEKSPSLTEPENLDNNSDAYSPLSASGSKPRRFPCQFCGKQFTLMNVLKVHERIHTGEKPYICEYCNKAFNQSGSLNRHKNTHRKRHQASQEYSCSQCPSQFLQASQLEEHEAKFHGNSQSQATLNAGSAFRHMKATPPSLSPAEAPTPPNLSQSNVPSSKSGALSLTNQLLAAAAAMTNPTSVGIDKFPAYIPGVDSGTNPFSLSSVANSSGLELSMLTCEFCGVVMNSRDELLAHRQRHLLQYSSLLNGSSAASAFLLQNLTSNSCFNMLNPALMAAAGISPSSAGLSVTSRTSSITGPSQAHGLVAAALAGKSGPTPSGPPPPLGMNPNLLLQHANNNNCPPTSSSLLKMSSPTNMASLSPEKSAHISPRSGSDLNKSASPSSLSQPRGGSSSEDGLSPSGASRCRLCDMSFPSNAAMLAHVRLHETGGEGKKCLECSKVFGCPSALKIHYRKHTGERPYVCEFCDKAFSQNGTLRRHQATCRSIPPGFHFERDSLIRNASNNNNRDSTLQKSPAAPSRVNGLPQQQSNSLKRDASEAGLSTNIFADNDESANEWPMDLRENPTAASLDHVDGIPNSENGVNSDCNPEKCDSPSSLMGRRANNIQRNFRRNDKLERSTTSSNASTAASIENMGSSLLSQCDLKDLMRYLTSSGKLYRCEHCQIFFLDSAMFHLHRGMHSESGGPFCCAVCGYQADDKYRFSTHFLEHGNGSNDSYDVNIPEC